MNLVEICGFCITINYNVPLLTSQLNLTRCRDQSLWWLSVFQSRFIKLSVVKLSPFHHLPA